MYILNILPFSFFSPLLTPVTSKGKKCRSKLLLKIKDKRKNKFKSHSQFSKIMGGKGSSPFFPLISGRANNPPQTKVWIPALNQLQQTGGVLVFLSLTFLPWVFPKFSLCCWFGIHIHLNRHTVLASFSCGKEMPRETLHWVNKHLFYLHCPYYLRIPFDAPLCWESQGTIVSSFSPCHSRFLEMSYFSSSVLCFFFFFPLFFFLPPGKKPCLYNSLTFLFPHCLPVRGFSQKDSSSKFFIWGEMGKQHNKKKKSQKNILLW